MRRSRRVAHLRAALNIGVVCPLRTLWTKWSFVRGERQLIDATEAAEKYTDNVIHVLSRLRYMLTELVVQQQIE